MRERKESEREREGERGEREMSESDRRGEILSKNRERETMSYWNHQSSDMDTLLNEISKLEVNTLMRE